jgi:hypothetical protein
MNTVEVQMVKEYETRHSGIYVDTQGQGVRMWLPKETFLDGETLPKVVTIMVHKEPAYRKLNK